MTNEEFLRNVCPNHTEKSKWNKSELLHILKLHKEQSHIGTAERLPSDKALIELAKNNCMLHRTSDELGFLVSFDLNDLRQFCTKLLKGNTI